MDLSRDTEERRFNTMALSFGVALALIIGVVLFAVTGSPAWIGILIPFGAAAAFAFVAIARAR